MAANYEHVLSTLVYHLYIFRMYIQWLCMYKVVINDSFLASGDQTDWLDVHFGGGCKRICFKMEDNNSETALVHRLVLKIS